MIVGPPRARPPADRGACVGAACGCPFGQRCPPDRAPARALFRHPDGGSVHASGSNPSGKGHACRTICHPASTSRRWKPGRVRSRASARLSPHSSGSRLAGPRTRQRWSRTGASSRPRSASSSKARTSRTPSTATSSTAGAPPTSCASGADGVMPTASAELPSAADKGKPAFRVAALESGPSGNDITVEVESRGRCRRGHLQAGRQAGGKPIETYDNVSTEQGQAERRHGRQGPVQDDHDRGGRRRVRRPRRPDRSPWRAAAPRCPRASPPRTTSATPPTGPASPASRRSTRSRCCPCRTSCPCTSRASSTSRASRPSSWR